jgi:hypothetical protein
MRRLCTAIFLALCVVAANAQAADDPLPSWNDGQAKTAIQQFVQATTDRSDPKFVAPGERIATFDQDGSLWVEHPIYTQIVYCLERVPTLVAKRPELKNIEPFKTVLSGNRDTIAKLPLRDLEKILAATLTGMTVDNFQAEVKTWLDRTPSSTATNSRSGSRSARKGRGTETVAKLGGLPPSGFAAP